MSRFKLAAVLWGTCGAVGCASVPLPQDQVAHYEASVQLAKDTGVFKLQADEGHRGALGMSQPKEHMLLAESEMAVAEDMAASGDTRSALLLARAQSDVDLALGLARETKLRQAQGQPSPTGRPGAP